MSTTIYAKRFLDATAGLAPRDRKAIDSAVMEFARGSKASGLRLHKLNCRESRFHSISANKELRIIVLIDGDTRIVMHAGHHDAVYRWAERHEVKSHEITGVPQIIEFVEEVERRVHFSPITPKSLPLFADVSDEQLSAIGVPFDFVRLVRKVQNDDDLEKLSSALPEEAWEVLVEIAAGGDPTLLLLELQTQFKADDALSGQVEEQFPREFASPAARRRFWIADSEKALEQALSMPWAVWRVFLHPSQESAVTANHTGPARITGGAGTGKTVVLAHRAARLVREGKTSRILLSTFSKILAQHLAKCMDELIGDSPAMRKRVEVTHLHEHAFLAVRKAKPSMSMATTADLRLRLEEAAISVGYLARPMAFVRDEWNHVIDYWGVNSLSSYLGVVRSGRGKALGRAQRETLWPVFQHVLDSLSTDSALTRAAICELAAEEAVTQSYDHVLLDESQDFAPRELRYAMSLANAADNALFLGGDDGQRIYRNPFPLKSVGINIRGRSRRLRVNYRTSSEIHAFSAKVLPDETLDDEVVDSRCITSLFSGEVPEIVQFDSREAEAEKVVSWVMDRQASGVAVREIAVLARQRSRLQEISARLEKAAGQFVPDPSSRDSHMPMIDTLHAAKGLEFRAVVVVGAEEGTLPLIQALDGAPGDEAHELALARERHLLYVGCTRARDVLLITHLGNRSRFLPEQ